MHWLLIALLSAAATGASAQQRPAVAPTQPAQRTAPPQPARVEAPPKPIQVDSPQRTTATYSDWVMECETQAGPPIQKICAMSQVAQVQGKNIPFSRVAITHPEKGKPVHAVVQVPVNVSFATQVRIQTSDTDPGIAAPFGRCVPAGCFAEFDIAEDTLRKFRDASGPGKMTFADAGGHEVAIPLSFNGFAQAFEALAKE
jgi:invasion protein IalB